MQTIQNIIDFFEEKLEKSKTFGFPKKTFYTKYPKSYKQDITTISKQAAEYKKFGYGRDRNTILLLGRAFDPMRPGSINYSPNLRGQVDFLSRQDGMLSTNPGTGGMVYGPGSVLAGKNVSSMFGTNNYQKALDKQIDYFEKQKQKKGFLTKYQQKRLDDTKKEKKDFFDYRADVRDAAKTKYGGGYKGPTGKDVHGGGNISGSVSRGGTDDTPGTPFRRGGIASL